MTENQAIESIKLKLEPIIGLKAWGVYLKVGSFLSLNFGNKKPANEYGFIYGEFCVELWQCAWHIEKEDQIIAGCEDSHSKLRTAIKVLENLTIKSIDIQRSLLDITIWFENDVVLRSFSIRSKEDENWLVFMPNDFVLTVGSNKEWSYVQERNQVSYSDRC